jgi:PAS domain S-box-containing protein
MKKILIVDDIDENLYLLRKLLEGNGYTVDEARNGIEALARAQADPPDMIISDILMPEMDGFTFCSIVRKDETLKHVPFIFYTATYTDAKDEKLALRMGADAFIVKPTEPEEFMRRVEAILQADNNGKLVSPQKQNVDDEVILKEYNEVLIRKLEHKMLELEKVNKELEAEIEARKQAEKSLRDSEEKFKAIANYTVDWESWFGPDGKYLWVNRGVEQITGYSAEEILSMPNFITSMIAEEDRAMFTSQFKDAIKGSRGENYEFRYVHKNGSILWMSISWQPIFDEKGTALGIRISGRDITERKRIDDALVESELRYRILADSGQALIWTSGLDKKCDYFNKPWLAFTGRTLDQELGDGWVEGVHTDDLELCMDIYTTAFNRREPFSMVYRLRFHDGTYRWIQDDGKPRYDAKGDFIGYIGHCLDFTERKQAEEENRSKLNELQRWYAATLDREDRVLEIKKEVNDLLKEAGRPIKYGGS